MARAPENYDQENYGRFLLDRRNHPVDHVLKLMRALTDALPRQTAPRLHSRSSRRRIPRVVIAGPGRRQKPLD
jgi:hypothetical protein